ncbi:Glycine/sarcosine N-methyltransferase [subsurface metagenome]
MNDIEAQYNAMAPMYSFLMNDEVNISTFQEGFHVYASDISKGMLKEARKNAVKKNVRINFLQSSWEDLYKKLPLQFDFVVCYGNSFSHMKNPDMLRNSLASIRKILKPGSPFLFDVRNWENDFKHPSQAPSRLKKTINGKKIEIDYSWKLNGWNVKCQFITQIYDRKNDVTRKYACDIYPIKYEKIAEACKRNGFNQVDRNFFRKGEYYYVFAI